MLIIFKRFSKRRSKKYDKFEARFKLTFYGDYALKWD